ncbi:MAG: 50S ribosomal protein L4 [Leptospiraceae bacterium]|nr:50S ribosomal protein L4 [Leptospiraceae bacterium]
MKATKYKADGSSAGQLDLPATLFQSDYSKSAIYTVIRVELANRRQGTHKTKERSEISGGGKKPWRQKGTGNARQGTNRAPQWKGGGTVFGPRPRSYEIRLPQKQRHAGLRAILSSKAVNQSVAVIEDLKFDDFNTKSAYAILKKAELVPAGTVALIVAGDDKKLQASMRNIPHVRYIHASRLTAPELLYSDTILVTESALTQLAEQYAPAAKGAN